MDRPPASRRRAPDDIAPIDGRTRHYGHFYGVDDLPDDDRPFVVLWGNCQAEAMRILLTAGEAVCGVRVPPVHEIVENDLPHVHRLLRRADVLLAQPVADDYRGLPLGTSQIAAQLRPGARVVRWPVLFYAGLYPYQVLVRHPGAGDPPIVPYHDLRTLRRAQRGRRQTSTLSPRELAQAYRDLARESRAQLARREDVHGTVVVSDVLDTPCADLAHTINHPGNTLLLAAARRLQAELGWPQDAVDPGRTLLSSVLTPLEPDVLDALGLDVPPRPSFVVGGRPVDTAQVAAAHLDFYARHPGVVAEGLRRHAFTFGRLGWR